MCLTSCLAMGQVAAITGTLSGLPYPRVAGYVTPAVRRVQPLFQGFPCGSGTTPPPAICGHGDVAKVCNLTRRTRMVSVSVCFAASASARPSTGGPRGHCNAEATHCTSCHLHEESVTLWRKFILSCSPVTGCT